MNTDWLASSFTTDKKTMPHDQSQGHVRDHGIQNGQNFGCHPVGCYLGDGTFQYGPHSPHEIIGKTVQFHQMHYKFSPYNTRGHLIEMSQHQAA
jgi:hypothetical protein